MALFVLPDPSSLLCPSLPSYPLSISHLEVFFHLNLLNSTQLRLPYSIVTELTEFNNLLLLLRGKGS